MLSDEDKKWIESKCGKVDRFWLYIMVACILINSCDILEKLTK